jgi:hypothetical protein
MFFNKAAESKSGDPFTEKIIIKNEGQYYPRF